MYGFDAQGARVGAGLDRRSGGVGHMALRAAGVGGGEVVLRERHMEV